MCMNGINAMEEYFIEIMNFVYFSGSDIEAIIVSVYFAVNTHIDIWSVNR